MNSGQSSKALAGETATLPLSDDLILWAEIDGQKKAVAQRYRSPKGKLRIYWFVSQHQRRNLLSVYLQDANPPK
ncbi:hypothetical protein K4F85_04165 [Phaeobacter inhibens]|uniref:hypothetical protein n=1 Tax=Phaeobacter inhibens TaxID=221822 RepID=UPI0021A96A18|nr:hypothetical protein [Phaeobacter inhibens]UWR42093.1 hypothetical protein K4F85_04165 [Phaeobacter inhibens]